MPSAIDDVGVERVKSQLGTVHPPTGNLRPDEAAIGALVYVLPEGQDDGGSNGVDDDGIYSCTDRVDPRPVGRPVAAMVDNAITICIRATGQGAAGRYGVQV